MRSGVRALAERHVEMVAAFGLLLLQLAWALTLPAFAGIDEFDHVYRAAGVVHGQVVAPAEVATRGTGAWLEVPGDIVAAARDECEELAYTTNADCRPSARDGDMVTVASGAGRYNPLYYAVIGWPSLFLEGDAAVIAMRFLTAIASTALFWAALVSLRRGFTTVWPAVGATLAASPMAVYSTSIVAPNGVEIMAAMALWASLNAALRQPALLRGGTTLWVFALSAGLLAMVRQLGPLWLILVVMFSVAAVPNGLSRVRATFRGSRVLIALGGVAVATLAGACWTLANGSLVVGVTRSDASVLEIVARLPMAIALWTLQSVAAFPMRNERAPGVVYFCFLSLWIVALILATRRGAKRESRCAWIVGATSLLVAAVITVRTYNDFGMAWQGRYALPVSIGTGILVGLALDRAKFRGPERWHVAAGGVAFAVGHAVGTASIALRQANDPAGFPRAFEYAGVAAVTVGCLVGGFAMAWAATRGGAGTATEVNDAEQPTVRLV